MNKLIVFPMAVLFVLTFIGVAMSMSGFTNTNDPIGTVQLNGTQENGWDVTTWDLTSTTALTTLLIATVCLVAFAGITILGSKLLSDMGQLMLLKILGYFGLYFALSVGAGWATGAFGVWGTLSYMMLTVMFSLGFLMDIRSGTA